MNGIFLDRHQHFEEALRAIETAIKLGAQFYEAFYFLANSALHSGPSANDAAESAIRQALQLSPGDPWANILAGRIAFAKLDYPLAIERYRAAVSKRPNFVDAHTGLAQAYTALGRKQDADAELARVRTIQQGASHTDIDTPPYLARIFQGSLLAHKTRSW